jgi:hypothetical protein
MSVLVKIPRNNPDLAAIKSSLVQCVQNVLKEKAYRNTRIIIDVDPV